MSPGAALGLALCPLAVLKGWCIAGTFLALAALTSCVLPYLEHVLPCLEHRIDLLERLLTSRDEQTPFGP